jgi:hypothetical protein
MINDEAGFVLPINTRTYYASNLAYAAYATPTDIFSLVNPLGSGRLLVPRVMSLLGGSTAAALMKLYWYRRALLNTGGTPTDLTAVQYDSNSKPAVGIARLYTVAPTIVDAAAAIINLQWASTTVLTAAPTNFNSSGGSFGWALNASDFASPLVLYPGQELAINLAGAALPAGFTAVAQLSWMEHGG